MACLRLRTQTTACRQHSVQTKSIEGRKRLQIEYEARTVGPMGGPDCASVTSDDKCALSPGTTTVDRGLRLGASVTATMDICGVASRALLLVACARHLQQTLAQCVQMAGVDTSHPECARTRSKRSVLHSFTLQ